MYFRIKIIILLLSIPALLYCQTTETLLTINNKKISKSEFIAFYNRNIPDNIRDSKDSANQYLKQFIDFKIKVSEAENQGFDKNINFIVQFADYKKQLLNSYLADNEIILKLAKEAYSRLKTQFRIRQILLKVDYNASPKDTLTAYQKALKVLKRLSAGEDFETLVKQVSDDPTASGNYGDLWYIGPFALPYNLENYIYNSNSITNKYSGPIRTNLGYHIIEISDRRNNPGIYKVGHILLSAAPDTSAQAETKVKQLADSIYFQLRIGQDFNNMAMKLSKDFGTNPNKGELPRFETGTMPHEFESATYNLTNDGEVSKPVKSQFGWHIIKLIDHNPIPLYSQIEDQLIKMVTNGDRGELATQKTIEKLKLEFQFTDFGALPIFTSIVDSTIFTSTWKIPEYADLTGQLFSIDNHLYTQNDFAKYIESNQKNMFPIPAENYLFMRYNEFIKQELLIYKEKALLQSDKKYKELVNDFRDNILYYSIMKKEVWDKSEINEAFTEYYNKNKEKYNNSYKAEVSIFTYNTNQPDKIEKQIIKLKELNNTDLEIESKIQLSLDKDFKLIQPKNAVELNATINSCINKINKGEIPNNENLILFEEEKKIVWINGKIEKIEIPTNQLMDKILTDYQKKNEESWLINLKQKYRVEINESVFTSIFNN